MKHNYHQAKQYIKELRNVVDLYDYKRIGNISGIYFVLDENKECIYVGKSKDGIAHRFKIHFEQDPQKWLEFIKNGATQIAWIPYDKIENNNLGKDEHQWIQLLNPPANHKKTKDSDSRPPKAKGSCFDNELLMEYVKLRDIKNEAQRRMYEIESEVISIIKENSKEPSYRAPKVKVRNNRVLKVVTEKEWEYSQKVKEQELKLNALKKYEENNNKAQVLNYNKKVQVSSYKHQ
ncbi:hypothetical protein FRE64_07625 [Euhalothece natronophila Z-M001]|uniref:GIY-YIG domain-containing protein n=1 Tax=Euhalothece natronophila Z-M001 TaxID=522448 RepID=A0A5B8NMQ8_9CHRO|nr:GIY-YIG nuclease family protein [Euhalothece natronophila]QDZ39821.1 hypothetical protein FRE64_07625 [Euhalothece natronophila Z-M001]